MPLILLSLLLFATSQAQAGYPVPDTETLKANAAALTQDGVSLKAFNYVQDLQLRPHVEEVRYDSDTDRFYWKGPRTGKPMSMDRERFTTEIFYPYYRWCDRHNSD